MKKSLSRFSSTLALVAPAAALFVSHADAAAYIKFDGIDGESQDKDHKGWSDLQSYSWAVSQSSQVAGGGAGKVSVKDFSIVHRIDKSSPMLFLATAEGRVIPTVTLSMTRNVGGREVEYYKITMKDVLISSISSSSLPATATEGDRVVETVSFRVFPKVEIEYTPIDEATGLPTGEVVTSGEIETDPPVATN
ncbi:MAG: type VI secretion system tube protein Hcp [Akkermansiaceae bacterium]|nr:type VI secretion system tube protein Hcp [Akkermansiaceae bacterium]MCF7730988.1 type VI secretion system tube protein Hcp [Akkermansiaceae bacterium]